MPTRSAPARRCLAAGGALLALAATAAPLRAQINSPFLSVNLGGSSLPVPLPLTDPAIGCEHCPKAAEESSAASRAEAVLAYAPSPARRRANLARLADQLAAGDPQGAAALRQLQSRQDVIAVIGRELAPLGLRVDNLADAYAVYCVNAWQAAHQDTRPTGRAVAQAVRAQVARALLGSRAVARATDADKQELAEALLVQAALLSAAQERFAGDPGRAAQTAAAARQGARAAGLDLDAVRLTDDGFVRADGAGRPARPDRAADAIAAVVLEFTNQPGVMFAPRLLYADGRVVDPPARGPDDRGRWSGTGRNITVRWESGRVSQWTNIGTGAYWYARPGAPGHILSGTFRTLSSSTVAGTTAFSARAYTFRPDGTFTTEGAGGGFGPGAAAVATAAGAGRYRIDGWTIALTYPDGRTERGLFYRYPDSETTVGIGTAAGVRTFSKDE